MEHQKRLVIRQSKLPEVIDLKGTAIKALIRDDPCFPKPIMLGPRSKGFLVSEVEAWLEARKAQRDAA